VNRLLPVKPSTLVAQIVIPAVSSSFSACFSPGWIAGPPSHGDVPTSGAPALPDGHLGYKENI